MEKETHVPKKVIVNGKEKTVYVRTDQTERELNDYRLGFFAGVAALPLASFGDKLKEKQLVIVASYKTGLSAIRSRLELDRRPHKVLTGTALIQSYFDNDNYRDGFPIFKQFYIHFGYTDSNNRKLHELVNETFYTRYQAENHVWLIVPFNLDVMAVRWGSAMMNLQTFPILNLRKEGDDEGESDGPVSPINSITLDAVGEQIVRNFSHPEVSNEFEAPQPVLDDPEEKRRRKRDYEKLRRKLYE